MMRLYIRSDTSFHGNISHTMHFYLPRRHRRQLLFPPGLLGLAGLLWLGCVVIGQWQEQLKRKVVMQLSMPLLHPPQDSAHEDEEYNVFSPDRLTPFSAWHDTYFNGLNKNDSTSATRLTCKAANMQADPLLDQRIRVRFGPRAKYAELVFVLNTMLKYRISRYALDIRHTPTTLYAFTVSPLPPKKTKPAFIDFCGTRDYQLDFTRLHHHLAYSSVAYSTRFGNWLAVLWNPTLKDSSWYTAAVGTGTEYDITLRLERQHWREILQGLIAPFRRPEWRIQFLLIVCMVGLSWWKIKRHLQYQ